MGSVPFHTHPGGSSSGRQDARRGRALRSTPLRAPWRPEVNPPRSGRNSTPPILRSVLFCTLRETECQTP
eukprot:11364306-Alexandrium_andersonii.AAC.1